MEGLISGLLSVVAISVTLLVLDVQLGLIALAAFFPILWATRWFQYRCCPNSSQKSTATPRRT